MACEDRVQAEEDGGALARRLTPLLAGATLALVGPGQFFGRPGLARVTLLRVEPGPPEALWDGPVVQEQVAALRTALAAAGPALPGELDTMHATAWSTAWSVPPAPPLVVTRDGVVLRGVGGELELPDRRRVGRSAVERVEATLSSDWILREVDLLLAGGERVTVASVREHFVAIDPTYDGIDLMFDGAWAPALARAVGAALGVPVSVDEAYG